jgi:hypothetical protein
MEEVRHIFHGLPRGCAMASGGDGLVLADQRNVAEF